MAPNEDEVEVFDRDAAAGGYVYARGDRVSSTLANARLTEAILAAADFRGRRVIDLGCGDGTYTLMLRTDGGAGYVLGIDPAASAIQAAKDKARWIKFCDFAVGGILDPPSEGSFEFAVIRGVLHHLADPASAIGAAFRLAEQVVIVEPNGTNPVLKIIEKLSPYHRLHREQSYLPSTLDAWIEAAGGLITRRRYVNLVPMFCPDGLARTLKVVEPFIEAVPIVCNIACGQYVVTATRGR